MKILVLPRQARATTQGNSKRTVALFVCRFGALRQRGAEEGVPFEEIAEAEDEEDPKVRPRSSRQMLTVF